MPQKPGETYSQGKVAWFVFCHLSVKTMSLDNSEQISNKGKGELRIYTNYNDGVNDDDDIREYDEHVTLDRVNAFVTSSYGLNKDNFLLKYTNDQKIKVTIGSNEGLRKAVNSGNKDEPFFIYVVKKTIVQKSLLQIYTIQRKK